jgi:GT2 family glycosyltransferase
MSKPTIKRRIARFRRKCLLFLFKGKHKASAHSLNTYQRWIELHESHLSEHLEKAPQIIKSWPEKGRPFFSVILPVYNTDKTLLNCAIESVREQVYPHWELCISDDASTEAYIRPLLEEWIAKDKRINVVFRQENGHISINSNNALEIASGDYCVLMDHDDELRPHSLFEAAKVISNKPETLFIYSDEDKIDSEGNRSEPHFKSSWNPDLLYAQNYLNHLTILKTSRLREIGAWRVGYEGSQDHDLYLRYLHDVDIEKIIHIPQILYHWRAIEGSAALTNSEKNYTHKAGIKALTDHLQNVNAQAKVSMTKSEQYYRIKWPVPPDPPLVSLIIPTKDFAKITQVCVESILEKTTYPNYEIIIVNNNSEEEETFTFFKTIQRKSTRVRVIDYTKPFNYAAINNYAVEHAAGEVIGLVNNDIEIINEGWLTEMLSQAIRPEIGCVGAKLYYPNNTIQHAGVILGIGGVAGHSHKYFPRNAPGYFSRLQLTHNLSAVTAALLLVKKSIFKEVGGLNEKHLKVAFNDVDLCLKVMGKGHRNLWTPYAEAYHHESKSRGRDDCSVKMERFHREIKYMQDTWGDLLNNDPYHSPNLTNEHEDFSYCTRPSAPEVSWLARP